MHETCEMRRARAYGIEEQPSTPASNTASGYSPLAEWEARKRDPKPNPRDYLDPLVFALALGDWERRNA